MPTPINATGSTCRTAYEVSNPYWCATHGREHEPAALEVPPNVILGAE